MHCPFYRQTPHSLVLYLEFSCWFLRSQCEPCANLHFFSQGQKPYSKYFLQSCDFSLSFLIEDPQLIETCQFLGEQEPSVETEQSRVFFSRVFWIQLKGICKCLLSILSILLQIIFNDQNQQSYQESGQLEIPFVFADILEDITRNGGCEWTLFKYQCVFNFYTFGQFQSSIVTEE